MEICRAFASACLAKRTSREGGVLNRRCFGSSHLCCRIYVPGMPPQKFLFAPHANGDKHIGVHGVRGVSAPYTPSLSTNSPRDWCKHFFMANRWVQARLWLARTCGSPNALANEPCVLKPIKYYADSTRSRSLSRTFHMYAMVHMCWCTPSSRAIAIPMVMCVVGVAAARTVHLQHHTVQR